VTLANWRLLNGLILRNIQTINPVSDFHQFVETAPDALQKEITKGREFIEFIQEEDKLLSKLLSWGGSGLFRIGNTMNHSCNPNTVIASCYPDYRIKAIALRSIKKGEELHFSYIDETQPFAVRQQKLREQYLFTCQCEKCKVEASLLQRTK
jgi:hypothetical protein